jgi:mannose-6-phosphate isomerase
LSKLYPLQLIPTLHVKVWGGRKLATVLGKTLPTPEPYGEAWELHDSSTIANGVYAGWTLAELIAEQGTAIIGAGFDPAEGMPLLIKLLDAADWLSVQVHPNDEQAKILEGDPRGKTEAWLILAADPGAKLVIGVQPGTARASMVHAIQTGTLEKLLVYAQVQAGDVLYLPANTIHALGPGILLYEVQQSSDMTYRLYDWQRLGLDGQPRALHIEKGVQVSNVAALPTVTQPTGELLVAGTYFQTLRHTLNGSALALNTAGHFHALTCSAGKVHIEHSGATFDLALGQTALIPAALGAYAVSGVGTILRSWMV